mgnify:CR=1 FL=1
MAFTVKTYQVTEKENTKLLQRISNYGIEIGKLDLPFLGEKMNLYEKPSKMTKHSRINRLANLGVSVPNVAENQLGKINSRNRSKLTKTSH